MITSRIKVSQAMITSSINVLEVEEMSLSELCFVTILEKSSRKTI